MRIACTPTDRTHMRQSAGGMAARITNRSNTSCASPSRLSNGSPTIGSASSGGQQRRARPAHQSPQQAVHSVRCNDDGSATGTFWKYHLMLVQENAPKPILVQAVSSPPIDASSPPYGLASHGRIERRRADELLAMHGDGSYLVRESARQPGTYTLCMRFDGSTLNFRLYFDGSQHYVGNKRFSTLHDLVADGLICMHVDQHEGDYITRMTEEANYEEAPYSQYQRMTQRCRQRQRRPPLHSAARPAASSGGGGPDGGRHYAGNTAATSASDRSAASGEHEPAALNSSGGGGEPDQDLLVNPEDSVSQGGGRPGSQLIADTALVQFEAKAHRFKVHTFKANFCDFCGNFMWGLVQQGVKCEDCGFAAHKKCSHKTYDDCVPSMKYVKRMFAVDLTTLCMAHGVNVPPIVNDCIAEVDSRGLFVEGIYRVSGSHDEIDKLRIMYDVMGATASRPTLLGPHKVDDINSIAGLLKSYLRMLPQPLLTVAVYRNMINSLATPMSEAERVKTMAQFANTLPLTHHETLKALMQHLQRVAKHSAANKMTAENLATVIAPTLFLSQASGQHGEQPPVSVRHGEHRLLLFLITNADRVFL